MSFVTWPCRNVFASGPLRASLPRSERSTRPQPSIRARYPAASVSAGAVISNRGYAGEAPLHLVLQFLHHARVRHAGRQGRAHDLGLLGAVELLEEPQQAVEALAAGGRERVLRIDGEGHAGHVACPANHAACGHVPGDRRLAAVGLDGPRARPARARGPLRRRRDAARDLQRAAVFDARLALAAARRPPVRACRVRTHDPRRAAAARRRRPPRRTGAARGPPGPRGDDPAVGSPGVLPAGVPAPARPVVARVVAVFDDLLLGSNVLGMLRAAGHDARLSGGADVHPDGADVLIVDLAAGTFDGIAVVEALAAAGELAGTRTLGVYSHVDAETCNRAGATGFDLVVPRSRMAREGTLLVERLAS